MRLRQGLAAVMAAALGATLAVTAAAPASAATVGAPTGTVSTNAGAGTRTLQVSWSGVTCATGALQMRFAGYVNNQTRVVTEHFPTGSTGSWTGSTDSYRNYSLTFSATCTLDGQSATSAVTLIGNATTASGSLERFGVPTGGPTFDRSMILAVQNPGSNTQTSFHTIGASNGALGLSPLWSNLPYRINAIAYNPADGYVYGIRESNDHLYRLFGDGTAQDLGKVGGLPPAMNVSSTRYAAGEFAKDGPHRGKFVVALNGSTTTHVIDLSTGGATYVTRNSGVHLFDFAWIDGHLWGVAESDGVYRVNLDTGTFTKATLPPGMSFFIGTYGSAWTLANGNLGVMSNSLHMYQFEIVNSSGAQPSLRLIAQGFGNRGLYNTDTTFVNPPPGLIDLSVVKEGPETASPGDTITYRVTVRNNSPLHSSGFVLTDTLPAGVTLVPNAKWAVVDDGIAYLGSPLAPGATEVVEYQVKVGEGVTGELTNVVRVLGNEEDPNPDNDVDDHTANGPGPDPCEVVDGPGSLRVTALADADGTTPVPGIEIAVERLTGVDTTTAAGRAAAAAMTVAQAQAAPRDPAVVRTTDANGQAVFSPLPLGLYLVTDTRLPDGVIPVSGPSLAMLPAESPDDECGVLPDVSVSPRYSAAALTKAVTDADAAVSADTVTFDVSMTVPKGATSLVLTDQLDPRLAFVLDDASFAFTGSGLGARPLSAGTGTVTFEGGLLTVTYRGAVLAEHDVLGFRIGVRVNDVGVIVNEASYQVTTPGGTAEGDSNEVETRWGELEVLKTGLGDTPLEGAEFCVAATEAAARARECLTGTATSGPDGRLTFSGLRYSQFANDVQGFEDQSYWLVELTAPVGYKLQAEPVEFRVSEQADGEPDVTVVNVPHNAGIELPPVGGAPSAWPVLMALAAAGGLAWMVRTRRLDATRR